MTDEAKNRGTSEAQDENRFEPVVGRRCGAVKVDGHAFNVCNRTKGHADEHERWSHTGIRIDVWPISDDAVDDMARGYAACRELCLSALAGWPAIQAIVASKLGSGEQSTDYDPSALKRRISELEADLADPWVIEALNRLEAGEDDCVADAIALLRQSTKGRPESAAAIAKRLGFKPHSLAPDVAAGRSTDYDQIRADERLCTADRIWRWLDQNGFPQAAKASFEVRELFFFPEREQTDRKLGDQKRAAQKRSDGT